MNEPLTAQDFVFYKENDQIMSGGYSVDSILLNQNRSPIISSNKEQMNLPQHWSAVQNAYKI